MRTCLGTLHLESAASGLRVYFRWIGNGERASVSLWRVPDGYVLDQMAGVSNAPLSRGTAHAIRVALVEALGPGVLDHRRRR